MRERIWNLRSLGIAAAGLPLALSLATSLVTVAGLSEEARGAGTGELAAVGLRDDQAASIEALPGSLDLLISVQDLTGMRARAGGRALLSFLGEVGQWERSTSALTDLGRALDLPADRAIDELVGRSCVLGVRGAWGHGAPGTRSQTMLLSSVSDLTERRLRERLKPAPRGLESGLPILALEGGGVELATALTAEGNGRLLISPRGSSGLFDEMLGVLNSGTMALGARLEDRAWWGNASEITSQPLVVMIRDGEGAPGGQLSAGPLPAGPARDEAAAIGASDRYFVLGGRVGERGFAGRFVASDSMLLGSQGQEEPGLPGGVLARLESNAILLMAGSLHGGAPGGDAVADAPEMDEAGGVDAAATGRLIGAGLLGPSSGRTLMASVLSMIRAPEAVAARLLGPAVLAVHEAGTDGGLAGTMVARVDRTREAATEVHRWLSGFAEQGRALGLQEKLDRAPLGLVRVLMISAGQDGPMEGYLRRGGSVAWCFVPDAGAGDAARVGADSDADGPGWWVVSVRTVAGEEAACREQVEGVARVLVGDSPVEGLYYRLSLRPARLAAIAAANREPSAPAAGRVTDPAVEQAGAAGVLAGAGAARSNPGSSSSSPSPRGSAHALRWLDEVSTSVQRRGPGVVMGGVKVMMDTRLLGE